MGMQLPQLTEKDFKSDQEVRWCPGCGDYAILKKTQQVLAELGIPREQHVFISGIGCSSRFPYYVNTYGFHTIHGRAPAVATGAKVVRPDLSVWVITGDGDALSIGGNHFIHVLRRNVGVKVLLFNNRIYGLTKGQYSPTSTVGKTTASTPMGSPDYPLNPLSLALGAEATFVARSMDKDLDHLAQTLRKAAMHKGTAFVEILQNCNVFNDGEWDPYTEKATRPLNTVRLEAGQPLVYANGEKGIKLNRLRLETVDLGGQASREDLVVSDPGDLGLAMLLARMNGKDGVPLPIGVFYETTRATYESDVNDQVARARGKQKDITLDQILRGNETWVVA